MASRYAQPQQTRLTRFESEQSVDIHCHCLPGLDDGPATLAEAVTLCRALVGDGITAVIATPHQFGRYDRTNPADRIRAAAVVLREKLAGENVPLTVHVGADVRLDERLMQLLDADEILTLADSGKHILLELPHDSFIDPLMLIDRLSRRGIQAIVSHPERYPHVCRRPDVVRDWVTAGAVLQITAASLLGEFGGPALTIGWELLGWGLPVMVATDAHNIERRPPRLTRAIEAIERRLGYALARRACVENPLRVLNGQLCAGRARNEVAQRGTVLQ
ncbi:MAG TPA: CpsB/CapC family capsule biosynthesis tyrosine phosphatase [Tepidisphaeraceae bacterium]|nr:CpsB/CapC family capsule biosynthesis tyrosine phosphatase [Tepidisphaeraceae bacterium]